MAQDANGFEVAEAPTDENGFEIAPPHDANGFEVVGESPAEQAPWQKLKQEGLKGIGRVLKGAGTVLEAQPPMTYTEFPDARALKVEDELIAAHTAKTPAQRMRDIQSNPIYVAGQSLEDVAPEVHPVTPAQEKGKLTQLGGSIGGFVPLVASGPFAPATIGLQSVGEHITSDYENAKQQGLDDDQAADTAMKKAVTSGTLQAGVFAVLPAPVRGVLEKYLVDRFGKAGFARWLSGRVSAGAEGAVLGGTSKAGENVVEGEPVTKDVGGSAGGLAAMNLVLPWLRKGERPPETALGRANGVSTPVSPDQSSAQPAQRATAPPVEVTPDVAKDLIEQLTKGQIGGEEKRPEATAQGPKAKVDYDAMVAETPAKIVGDDFGPIKPVLRESAWQSVMDDDSLPIELRKLARRVVRGEATPEEQKLLEEWHGSLVKNEQLTGGGAAGEVTEAPATREALTEASQRTPEGTDFGDKPERELLPRAKQLQAVREALGVGADDAQAILDASGIEAQTRAIQTALARAGHFEDIPRGATAEGHMGAIREATTQAINIVESIKRGEQPLAAEAAPKQPTVAEPQSAPVVPPKKKPNPFWVRPRSDGVPDILDDIQELGGIRPPGPDAGGEYDGFSEAMTGTARMLVKKSAAHAPDTLIQELHSMGNQLQVQSPDDLWNAIRSAVKDRQKLATTGGGHEAQTVKFWSAVLDPKNKSGLERINVQQLKVGDTFRIRGPGISHEELTVTHLDHDTGDIQVKDGPKLGVQDIPDGTQLWVKKGGAPQGVINTETIPDVSEIKPESKPAPRVRTFTPETARITELHEEQAAMREQFADWARTMKDGNPWAGDIDALRARDVAVRAELDSLISKEREGKLWAKEPEQMGSMKQAKVTPTLRPGEKGTGDLLQGEDQPFNLSGEKASDADRIAHEKSQAEATAREAKEIEAKEQQELPEVKRPWQMRRDDYARENWQGEIQRFKDRPDILDAKNRDEEIAHYKQLHLQEVTRAVQAGKPVPEEVLADYPFLKPKQPSIGSGIKAALEKNQGGEAGFVRIPSRQELLDHFTDLGDQLREAAKYVSSKRRQLVERLKRGGDFDTISRLKDAAENMANLMGKETGNFVRHDLNRAFGVKAERVRKERNDLRESALTFAIEATGDKGRLAEWRYLLTRSEVAPRLWRRRALQAIEFADTHWDKLQPVVETYRRITDAENAYENANGIATLYREGGYVFHAQDLEATYNVGNGGLVTQGAGGAATPFRKGRDYPTYAEAIANGVNPKSLNGVDLLEHRVSIGQRAVNMTDWIDAMQHIQDKATKLPIVVKPEWVERTGNLGPSHREFEGMPPAKDTQGYYKVPPHYEVIEFGGKTIGLHKGFTGLFSSLTDPSWFQKSAGRKAFAGGMAFAKHTALLFDTYHLGRLAFWNSLSRGALPHLPTYDLGLSILENTLPELQRMVARGEIPKEWGKGLIESKTRLDAVMRAGGNLSSVGDNLHTEFLQRVPGLGTFNKWLFNKYQRGAMAEVALMEFDRQAKFHPGEEINVTARRVAKDVNTRFGNLQSQAWLKSKTGQDLARVLFLAPQWNESLIRSELGAMKQFGQAGMNLARGKRPALGMLARGIGSAVLGTFIANQIINLYTRGTPTWDNPEEEAGAKISAWIPDKVGGGPGYFLNPLSLPAEMMNLLYRGVDRNKGKGAEEASSESILAILKGRMSPLAKGIYTWVTGETPMGVKVGHGFGTAVKEAIPAPISGGAVFRGVKQVVTGEHQEKYPGEFEKQIMQSFGVKTEQAPSPEKRIRTLAVEFNSRHKVSEDTGAYAPSRFADLIAAIRRQNMSDAKGALDTILTTDKANGEPTKPKDVYTYFKKWESAAFTKAQRREAQFRMTLNAEQRKVYDQARKDRIAIAQKVNAMLKARVANP